MNFKLLFTLSFCLHLCIASANAIANFTYEVTALHHSELVVTGKIIPSKGDKFNIEINDILKAADHYSFKPGQKISVTIPSPNNFGSTSRVYESEYIMYLIMVEGQWTLLYNEDHVEATENGLIPFDLCERTYWLTTQQYKQINVDLWECFSYVNDYRYQPILTPAQYQEKDNHLDVVLQFYRCNSNLERVDQYMEESEFLGPDYAHFDTTVYDFCETQQGLTIPMSEFMEYVELNTPEEISTNKWGIEGNIYVKFVIEPDSTGSQFRVVRGIHPELDPFAIELVKGMAPFVPGTTTGVAVRSSYMLPIKVRLKKD